MVLTTDDPKWNGPSAWDVLLLRLLKDPDGLLFWKKSSACAVSPCFGSWSGHTSGSQQKKSIEPCGFDKPGNRLCQEGTRRWMKMDKSRYLVGFSWTGQVPYGPIVDEAEQHMPDDPWHETSVTWLSQRPPDVPPENKSSENQLPFRHPDGTAPPLFPPLESFGPMRSFNEDGLKGDSRKRRTRELVRLYERRVWTSHKDYDASWSDCMLPAPFMVANRECFGGPAALRGYEMAYCKPIDDMYRESMYHGRLGRGTAEAQLNPLCMTDQAMWQVSREPPILEASLRVAMIGGQDQAQVERGAPSAQERTESIPETVAPNKNSKNKIPSAEKEVEYVY